MSALRECGGIVLVTAVLLLPFLAFAYPDLVAWLIFGLPAMLIVGGCIADDYRNNRNRRKQ